MTQGSAIPVRLLVEIAPLAGDRVRPFDGTRAYVATGDLDDGIAAGMATVTFDERPSRADLVAAPGDVVFARMKATEKVLEVTDENARCVFSTGFAIVRPDPKHIESRYLVHYLRSPAFQITKDRLCTGATQKAITNGGIAQLVVPTPPVAEQRRIVAILDRVESVRRQRMRAVELVEDVLQGSFLSTFGDPASNPKKWPGASLGELIPDGPQNGLYKPSTDYGSGTPIVRIDSYRTGEYLRPEILKRVRLDDKTIRKYALAEGDVLINRVNSGEFVGKIGLVPALAEPTVFESNMMRCTLDTERILPQYLAQMFQTGHMRSQIQRATKDAVNQSSINQKDVAGLEIPLAPIELQQRFQKVEARCLQLRGRFQTAGKEVDALVATMQNKIFG